jgi:hypothetical protein
MATTKLSFLFLLLISLHARAQAGRIGRSRRAIQLVPTLTVDVMPSQNQVPVPFDTGKPKEYFFAVGEVCHNILL